MKKDVFNMPNPVTIMGRSSSITNSFVNGIIPSIEPSEEEIKEALTVLEQNEEDVRCVYCGDKKTEWDHLHPLIINKKHTSYITEISNLVPACGKCNQSKGNSDWKEWMVSSAEKSPKTRGVPDLEKRIKTIEKYDNYFKKRLVNLEELAGKELWEKYQRAYDSIIFNMESAQKIMDEIKQKIIKPKNIISERPRKVFVVNIKQQDVSEMEKKVSQKLNNNVSIIKKLQSNIEINSESVRIVTSDSVSFWNRFEKYLINRGYKEITPSGLPSTVPQYRKAVSDIKSSEGKTLQDFSLNIEAIISEYDIGGEKEWLGRTQHNTWINALKRFKEYICYLIENT